MCDKFDPDKTIAQNWDDNKLIDKLFAWNNLPIIYTMELWQYSPYHLNGAQLEKFIEEGLVK